MNKRRLLSISQKVSRHQPVSPEEIQTLIDFEKKGQPSKPMSFVKTLALPLSLLLGFLFASYPNYFLQISSRLPSWTNLPQNYLSGVDYLWSILGNPVEKQNIIYHLPNIVFYSFGILGIKKLIDALDRKTWLDRVLEAQKRLLDQITQGNLSLNMKKGHSLLFTGKGDFIGMQFTLNHAPTETVTIAEIKPLYTDMWNRYAVGSLYDDLKDVISRSDGVTAGEYVFFPVKDDQIFLPGDKAYDLSPHKLDILCQNIRKIEKEKKWKAKRIIIIGDKHHQSLVQSEDTNHVITGTRDIISLQSIADKYQNITLLDPSDIVLREILTIAGGRRIVFRATKDGIAEYKKRFYTGLKQLGYKEPTQKRGKKGVLTIGYDLFEDQTEQQTLSRKIDDYFPVVLSKNVHDALTRNGYKKSEFLYVPDLVLKTLHKKTSEQ